jgi:hypothetical protein
MDSSIRVPNVPTKTVQEFKDSPKVTVPKVPVVPNVP